VRLAIRFVHSKTKFYEDILEKLALQIEDLEQGMAPEKRKPQVKTIQVKLNLKRVSAEAERLRRTNCARKIQRWYRELPSAEESYETFQVNEEDFNSREPFPDGFGDANVSSLLSQIHKAFTDEPPEVSSDEESEGSVSIRRVGVESDDKVLLQESPEKGPVRIPG
jgi:hypothetical protein